MEMRVWIQESQISFILCFSFHELRIFLYFQGLSHEMGLIFDDMYGYRPK